MAYTDASYQARHIVRVVQNGTLGTATASGSNSLTGAFSAPFFPIRDTIVSAVRVNVLTAPSANLTNSVLVFKNGTATFAVATVGTLTAGQYADATVTAANGTLTNTAKPTVDFIGTATASGQAGSLVVDAWFECKEQFY